DVCQEPVHFGRFIFLRRSGNRRWRYRRVSFLRVICLCRERIQSWIDGMSTFLTGIARQRKDSATVLAILGHDYTSWSWAVQSESSTERMVVKVLLFASALIRRAGLLFELLDKPGVLRRRQSLTSLPNSEATAYDSPSGAPAPPGDGSCRQCFSAGGLLR